MPSISSPKNHTKPALQAAIAVYYAAMLNNEPIDINEVKEVFKEAGISIDALKIHIRNHNNEIRSSGASKEVKDILIRNNKKRKKNGEWPTACERGTKPDDVWGCQSKRCPFFYDSKGRPLTDPKPERSDV